MHIMKHIMYSYIQFIVTNKAYWRDILFLIIILKKEQISFMY